MKEMNSREKTADAAWFLYRMMPQVVGCQQSHMQKTLASFSVGRIVDDAEDIQANFFHGTADKVRDLLVGNLIDQNILVIVEYYGSGGPSVYSGPHTEAMAHQVVNRLNGDVDFKGSAWTCNNINVIEGN